MAKLGNLTVGDVVKIKVGGNATNFIVVQQGRPSTAYSSDCDGTWVITEKVYGSSMYWDSTNNDYENSDVHSYLNSTFYNLIDSNLRGFIKTVKIPYTKGTGDTGTVKTNTNGLSTKIFLPSFREVAFGSTTAGDVNIEGVILTLFKENGVNARKVNNQWWLRSPETNSGTSGFVASVQAQGSYREVSATGEKLYIRPMFILPTDLATDKNGNVVVSSFSGYANIGSVNKELSGGYANIGGAWKEISTAYKNIGGVWKEMA